MKTKKETNLLLNPLLGVSYSIDRDNPVLYSTGVKLNEKSGGFKQMSKIDKSEYEFVQSLKAQEVKKDIETTITGDKLLSTKYGEKRIITIAIKDDEGKDKQVFLNAMSMANLVTAYGDETDDWKDKPIVITTETSERTQGKKAIVIFAKKEDNPLVSE